MAGAALRDAHLTGSYTLTTAIDAVAQLAPCSPNGSASRSPNAGHGRAFPGKDCVADFQDWQPVTAAPKDHTVPVHGQDFGPEAYRD